MNDRLDDFGYHGR
ncbi:hypothetical protein D047_3752A, partial [Vibrio parahaemolyticus VPTS-2010_2]